MSSWQPHTVLGLKTLQAAHEAALFALSHPPKDTPQKKKDDLAAVVKILAPNQKLIADTVLLVKSKNDGEDKR